MCAQSADPLVSVIVLCYGSARFIGPCLASLAKSTWQRMDVIVADNASTDDSLAIASSTAEKLRLNHKLLPLPRNTGCAGGNNAAWREATGDIVVFLNPDTEVTPRCIAELVTPLLNDSTIGITGAKMYYPDSRTLQHAGGIILPNGMTAHWGIGQEDRGEFDTARDVDYVTGAGFAISRDLLEQLGGFDEEYFPAYYEEVDLCVRARKLGKRVVYCPAAVLTHHESVALGANSPALQRLYARMRVQFCLKNFSVGHLLRWSLPCEMRWMLYEPAARGVRRFQLRAYIANAPFIFRKLAGRNRTRRLGPATSKLP
jgi:O-antigen biosynthesis protein